MKLKYILNRRPSETQFYHIFDEYPPLELRHNNDGHPNEDTLVGIKAIDLTYNYKSNMYKPDFWNDALIKYTISKQIINEKYNDENLKQIYELIIVLINQRRNELQ